MPRQMPPLPQQLHGRAFHVAEARELCPERLLSTPDLWIPTRGVRLPVHARDLRSRCIAHAITLPAGSAFSHTTAAIAHALPLPSFTDEFVIHVTTPIGHRAPRRKDLVGHQRVLRDQDVVTMGRLRVTSLARTFIDLAELLDLKALVAVGDRLLWRRAPKLDRDELRRAITESQGRRGIAIATQALELLDDGAESPKESELRLLLRSAGFGPFTANFELFDARGDFVARIDLALPGVRIAIEYEGDHHRDRRQWREDIARRRRIEALGWVYIPVTQADLDDPHTLLTDLASALVARN